MEKLWSVGFKVAGLAAIGAFVFWSLYKKWLSLPIFSNLTPPQTFNLMLVFLGLVFVIAIVMVIAYVFLKWQETPKTSIDTLVVRGNVSDSDDKPIEGADVSINGISESDTTKSKGFFSLEIPPHYKSQSEFIFQVSFNDLHESFTVKNKAINAPLAFKFKKK